VRTGFGHRPRGRTYQGIELEGQTDDAVTGPGNEIADSLPAFASGKGQNNTAELTGM